MARFDTWKPEELTPERLAARNDAIRRSAELILLVRKPYVFLEDAYFGLVENSYSMSIEENRAFVYWSLKEMGVVTLTARDWAGRDRDTWQARHPDWGFAIWDINDPDLPVVVNWQLWLDGHAPSNDTLAGVKNKHEARNIRFHPKGQPPPRWWAKTSVVGLVPMATTLPATTFEGALAIVQLLDHAQAPRKIEP